MKHIVPLGLLGGMLVPSPASAQSTPPLSLQQLPIREVTIFKDGHAFILHEGTVPLDARGGVTLDRLPRPVLGTFWPYATGGKLSSVLAGKTRAENSKPTLALRDLLKANIGAEVTVVETLEKRFDARILDVPMPTSALEITPAEDQEDRSALYRAPQLPPDSQLILLSTAEGVRARSLDSIREVIFKNPPRTALKEPEDRPFLRLQTAPGSGGSANPTAALGMVYLQRGLRWIPSYRLQLGGGKTARIHLQGTLINELEDLSGVQANLVVGVPSFAFKDTVDPMALQNTFARLSPLFTPNSRSASALSNAISSQVASNSYSLQSGAAREESPLPLGEAKEDFFVYAVKDLTLGKGQRMSVPVHSSDLAYEDVYVARTGVQLPTDLYRSLNYEQRSVLDGDINAPGVVHKVRVSNTSSQPLTTAPVLIESGGRLLAQSLMTYTATGGKSDIEVAPAVDVTVKRLESETRRTPVAITWRNQSFDKIDVSGRMVLTSFKNEAITLELEQQFLGTVSNAGFNGTVRKLGVGDEGAAGPALPAWWQSYNGDWRLVNGLTSVKWRVELPARKSVEIPFSYSYYWR